jgi:hypothetical protein
VAQFLDDDQRLRPSQVMQEAATAMFDEVARVTPRPRALGGKVLARR